MTKKEQYQAVWNNGVFIDSVLSEGYKTALYAIDKFFVEVRYDSINNQIIDLKTFKHGHLMDKYSGDITF